jgi:hypothetical protein
MQALSIWKDVRTHEKKHFMHCIAKTLYSKNPKQIFPEMKLRGFVPNSYTHESVSNVYISTYFAAAK